MAISAVGTPQMTTSSSLTVTGGVAGNIWVFTSALTNASTSNVTGITGGGVAKWNFLSKRTSTGVSGLQIEIWWGVVVPNGPGGPITPTYSLGSPSQLTAQQFNSDRPNGTVNWTLTSGFNEITTGTSNLSAATIAIPNNYSAGVAYYGYVWADGTGTGAGTSGFGYNNDAFGNIEIYSTTNNPTQPPKFNQTVSGPATAVAALIQDLPNVTFVGSTSNTASAVTTMSLNKPTGVVDGDCMLAAISAYNSTITPPTGWTLIDGMSGNQSANHKTSWYWKMASGEPSSWSWTFGTSTWPVGLTYVLRGVMPGVPVAHHTPKADASAYTSTLPSAPATISTSGDPTVYLYSGINAAASGAQTLTLDSTTLSNIQQATNASLGGAVGIGWGINVSAPAAATSSPSTLDYMDGFLDLVPADRIRELSTPARGYDYVNSGTTEVISVTTAPASGSTLILTATTRQTVASTTAAVTDSKGNTWTVNSGPNQDSNNHIFVASTRQDVGTLTTSDTITITYGNTRTSGVSYDVREFTGIVNSSTVNSYLDQLGTYSAQTTNGTGPFGASMTPTGNQELMHATQTWNSSDSSAFTANASGTVGTYVDICSQETHAANITFVNGATASSGASTATSLACNKPSGVASGDFLIAQVTCTGATSTLGAPSGWLGGPATYLVTDSTSALHMRTALFWLVAGASEPSTYTFTQSATEWLDVHITAYRGVDGTNPWKTNPTMNGGTGTTTATTPSVTPTFNGEWVAHGESAVGTTTNTWTIGTGGTKRTDGAAGTGSNFISQAMGDSNGPLTTSAYSVTYTASATRQYFIEWAGVLNPKDTLNKTLVSAYQVLSGNGQSALASQTFQVTDSISNTANSMINGYLAAYVSVVDSDTISAADTSVKIGVSDTETGTGTDSSGSTHATLSSAETGTGTEGDPAKIAMSFATDTGTGTDSSGTVGVSSADTASGSDTSTTLTASMTTTDTASGTDTSVKIGVSSAETLTGADNSSSTATLNTSDTASGTDSNGTVSVVITSADTITGTESNSTTATLSSAETIAGTESDPAKIAVSSSDTATGTEGFTIGVKDSDTFTASSESLSLNVLASDTVTATDANTMPSATLSTSDTVTGTDSQSAAVSISSADTVTATDSNNLTVSITSAETGTLTDNQSVQTPLTTGDTGSFAESASVSVTVSSADAVTGTEGNTVGITDTDAFTGTESAVVTNHVSDSDALTASSESAFTQATLSSGDTLTAVDNGTGGLMDADTGTFSEAASVSATLSASDTMTGVDSNGATGISSADVLTAVDSTGTVGIQTTDTVSATDVVSQLTTHQSTADTATATDVVSSLVVHVSSSDTITAVEGTNVLDTPYDYDNAYGTDLESVTAHVTDTDHATAAEGTPAVGITTGDQWAAADNANTADLLSSSDTVTATENAYIKINQSDVVTATDSAQIGVSSADAVSATEQATIGVSATETITFGEQTPKIGLKSNETVVADDEAVIHVSDSDHITAVDLGIQSQIGIPIHSSDTITASDNVAKIGVSSSDSATTRENTPIIGVSDEDFIDPPEIAIIGIPQSDSWAVSDSASVKSGPAPAADGMTVSENASVVVLSMGPNPMLAPLRSPLAPMQPYYLRRTQNWAIQNERQKHLQALYLYGEWTMFVLMWHIEDLNNGLVQHCHRCYGTGSAPLTREQRASAAYGNVSEYKCPDCFGTTFEGGYKAIIVRPAIFGDTDENQQMTDRGVTNPGDLDMESTPDFRVRTGDYSFRSTGDRYFLKVPDRITLRTGFATPYQRIDAIGYNHAKATIADPTSVAYNIPPSPEDLSTILNRSTSYQPVDFSAFEIIRSPLIPVAEDQG